jgi:hypothetical protein
MPEPNELPAARTLRQVLDSASPRPAADADSGLKNAYATRFANSMAECIACGLRGDFPGILPDENGRGAESPARAVRGPKRLDVNFSTPQLGLGLGISLKSVHFRETTGTRGYTHNLKRNDEELRVESSGYHARQPYAVMVATLFLPYDACDDARDARPSSFGAWVKYLRPLTGRQDPGDDIALFERVFIGLYDPQFPAAAPPQGGMEFFDVAEAPPRTGRPHGLLDFAQYLEQVRITYDRRNHTEFKWADGTPSGPDST